eukprot:c24768_g1_i1 orf=525-1385(+)
MADSSLIVIDGIDYKIEKRSDGTEDFHCLLPSCVGLFSYRTLRALNNHRADTHNMPEIPKRKRGPKRSESSRSRTRSAEAIKRQVIKRATDIDKRERGCRSMARLRALRHAMAQTGRESDKDNIAQVVNEVDKALESWEKCTAQRRMLLERRVKMARVLWATKGEPVPLLQCSGECGQIQIGSPYENEHLLALEHDASERCHKMVDEGIEVQCIDGLPNGKDDDLDEDDTRESDERLELENDGDCPNENLEDDTREIDERLELENGGDSSNEDLEDDGSDIDQVKG